MSRGTVFSIQEFTVHDGPGIRTTVFLKGCPLRCLWCHNPEGLSPRPQLMVKEARCTGCGKCKVPCGHPACAPYGRCTRVCPQGLVTICGQEWQADALAAKLLRNRFFYEEGGITFSGGEPLMQPEFLLELLGRLNPVHRAVETSAFAPQGVFEAVAGAADLMIADIKCMDAARHKEYTGQDNELILANLERLKALLKPFWVRIPLIPGVNDSPENLEMTAGFLSDCKDRVQVEVLPYNAMAGAKYASVGREYRGEWISKSQGKPDITPFLRAGIACHVR